MVIIPFPMAVFLVEGYPLKYQRYSAGNSPPGRTALLREYVHHASSRVSFGFPPTRRGQRLKKGYYRARSTSPKAIFVHARKCLLRWCSTPPTEQQNFCCRSAD